MDAHRGTYTSFQEFLSDRLFGAQAEFNRIDTSNSSYYSFDKGRFVLARNTRYGQMRAFGNGSSELIPLPERLYAGGPVSLRGFSQNAAGPRDPETGYPIGGAGALINSTELRLPPPTLPWFGNTLSFVIFHDMGNVFTNAGDAWASALRVRQPDSDACRNAVDRTDIRTNPTLHRQARPAHFDRPARPVQLQRFLACAGRGLALPHAGRAHPIRFQLQPESADLSGEYQLFDPTRRQTRFPVRARVRMSARRRTSTSSSAWGRPSDDAIAPIRIGSSRRASACAS